MEGGAEGEVAGVRPTSSETLTSAMDLDSQSTGPESTADPGEDGGAKSEFPVNRTEILRALEVVERDSLAISESFASLFASLRMALSEVFLLLLLFFFSPVWISRKWRKR